MEKFVGRFRFNDEVSTNGAGKPVDDEEPECICLKVPCTCKPVEDSECKCGAGDRPSCSCVREPEGIRVLSRTERFVRASDKLHGRNGKDRQRPAADRNMTPTQRFIAASKARWARQ
jgi:hypothetical protein